jgi:hypothetical protein
VRADVELEVQPRQVLFHRSLGDDELSGNRSDRRRLGERIARQQRAAQGQKNVALARREWRRLRDRGRLLPPDRTVEQQAESPEENLVARVQRLLSDDPSSVHEGAVARTEVADTPTLAESFERGVNARDSVRIHHHIVRLECSDGQSLGVQGTKLAPATAPHLDVAAHDEPPVPRKLEQAVIRRVYAGTFTFQPARTATDANKRKAPSPGPFSSGGRI